MKKFSRTDEVIRVSLDEPFGVCLESVPTSGYVWHYVPESDAMEFKGARYGNSVHTVGGAREEIFEFRACSKFDGDIVFTKGREWDPKPIEECHFHVVVE